MTSAFPQSQEGILYCSKITSILKFGVHGDMMEGTQPSQTLCSGTNLHQIPGHMELQGMPRAPHGKAGGGRSAFH